MLTVEVDIARPVPEVFAYLADNANETQWQRGLVSSELTSDGPVGVGTTGRDVRRSMGMKIVNEWECTAYEPDARFAFNVTKPMTFAASYAFAPIDGGTRVTMRVEPSGAARLVWPLIARMGRRQYQRDFARLKEVLEMAPGPAGRGDG